MKTLYLGSDEEEDQQEVEPVGTSRGVPSRSGDGASGSGAAEEEVIVEAVAE